MLHIILVAFIAFVPNGGAVLKVPNFLVHLLTFFGNTIVMIIIEKQYRGGSKGIQRVPWNPPFCQ